MVARPARTAAWSRVPRAQRHGRASRAHSGYLLNEPQDGAWQGVVQTSGPLLPMRLPTLVVWLSRGLRGPGVVLPEREWLERGLPGSK